MLAEQNRLLQSGKLKVTVAPKKTELRSRRSRCVTSIGGGTCPAASVSHASASWTLRDANPPDSRSSRVLIVVVFLSIAVRRCSCRWSTRASISKRIATARVLVSEFEYARNLAIVNNSNYRLSVDKDSDRLILEHTGSNTSLDALPDGPFRSSTDSSTQRVTRLASLPGISLRPQRSWRCTPTASIQTAVNYHRVRIARRNLAQRRKHSSRLALEMGTQRRYVTHHGQSRDRNRHARRLPRPRPTVGVGNAIPSMPVGPFVTPRNESPAYQHYPTQVHYPMIRLANKRCSPIGVDVGSHTIKLLQLTREIVRASWKRSAGTCPTRPERTKTRTPVRIPAVADTLKQADRLSRLSWPRGGSCAWDPASCLCRTFVYRRCPTATCLGVVQQEAAGRVPYDIAETEIRYIDTADIRHGGTMRREVIVLACHRPILDHALRNRDGGGPSSRRGGRGTPRPDAMSRGSVSA